MPFPTKLLTPGEEIVVEAHPNWSTLVRPISLTLLVVGGCVAAIALWGSAPIGVGYALAAIAALAALWLVAQLISWRGRLLVVTTSRVVYRWGIIRRTGREIPLGRVQDVTFHQTFIERLVGAGDLTIESAGASGQEPFPDVRHPAQIQSIINQLITGGRAAFGAGTDGPAASVLPATRAVHAAPAVPAAGAPAGNVLGEQLRDLERLHEGGVLTDDEFDRKRKQLLGLD